MNILKLISIRTNGLKLSFSLGLFLALQSCSGSKIGERLANSFESPLESSESSIELEKYKNELSNSINQNSKLIKKDISTNVNESKNFRRKEIKSQSKLVSKKNLSFTPKPYRVIIKIPRANPSAPAEVITNALRNAGIVFEIETIERLEKKSKDNGSSLR